MSTPIGVALVSSTSRTAGSGATRAAYDVSAQSGGLLTWVVTNGGTGPTVACTARVLVARRQSSMPTAAAEGTGDDAWKLVHERVGSLVTSEISYGQYRFGPEIAYVQIEFSGNTGQAVTVEATLHAS